MMTAPLGTFLASPEAADDCHPPSRDRTRLDSQLSRCWQVCAVSYARQTTARAVNAARVRLAATGRTIGPFVRDQNPLASEAC
ncbi:hypothetical protein EV646_114170 [Kribbella antiqua]|uniref:Uncharacterized protein n=1 Tax=Kribbella antiqua TaxID=2512217 RepID=A0A4R2IDU4_9ACTN|nr:hypothetical protein EV646_114170 [Kribbella antiqua]